MRRRFHAVLDTIPEVVIGPLAPEHIRALAVPCWQCEAPVGQMCPDDPEDDEIVYQWPAGCGNRRMVIFHDSRPQW